MERWDTGAPQERYKYDAYGQVTFLKGDGTVQPCNCSPLMNSILYTGRYFDIESRLYYYRARTYNPYLGRFLQRDPLGEAASLNLYNYVFNNPVNATDPTGMLPSFEEQGAQFWSDIHSMGGHGSGSWQKEMNSHSANMPEQGRDLGDMRHAAWERQQARANQPTNQPTNHCQ